MCKRNSLCYEKYTVSFDYVSADIQYQTALKSVR
jgi:hypothetical protein